MLREDWQDKVSYRVASLQKNIFKRQKIVVNEITCTIKMYFSLVTIFVVHNFNEESKKI